MSVGLSDITHSGIMAPKWLIWGRAEPLLPASDSGGPRVQRKSGYFDTPEFDICYIGLSNCHLCLAVTVYSGTERYLGDLGFQNIDVLVALAALKHGNSVVNSIHFWYIGILVSCCPNGRFCEARQNHWHLPVIAEGIAREGNLDILIPWSSIFMIWACQGAAWLLYWCHG